MEEVDSNKPGNEDTNVRVAVRCRPFNTKEKNSNEVSCVKMYEDRLVLVNPSGANEEHSFAFDLVYDQNSRQEVGVYWVTEIVVMMCVNANY
jgi:hypothetical protein